MFEPIWLADSPELPGVDPLRKRGSYSRPNASGDRDRERCCPGSGRMVGGGGGRPDTAEVLSSGYAASCDPPHWRIRQVLRAWSSRHAHRGQVLHHGQRQLLGALEREAVRPAGRRRSARERVLSPPRASGGRYWASTVVRAARPRRHHGWRGATARIQLAAPPRHGHHLEGPQERDLLPRVATQDHGQLEVPLAA